MPRAPSNQTDIVKTKLKDHAEARMTTITEDVTPPGIGSLHLKTTEEIAGVLVNILKSKRGVTAINYVIGERIQVTSQSNLSIDSD